MVSQIKWTERQFDFTLPVGFYPILLERFRAAPPHLEELMRLGDDKTLKLKKGTAWSPQEHAGHLIDLDELTNTRLNEFEEGADTLTAADMSNRKTNDTNYNEIPLPQILRNFRTRRMKLCDRFASYDGKIIEHTAFHPRLQRPMRLIDLLYFVCEHDDHHLGIIGSMLRG